MKVIPETRRSHTIWYLRFYYYHWVDATAVRLLVPEGIVHPVVNASVLTWLISYIYYIYSS